MLGDTNRTGVFTPNPLGFGVNIVDSGSDGSSYWNVFNIEGESALSAQIVTYATLADMLGDTNRTGVFTPNPLGFGVNIVGSESDGSSYWNVFNIEGESAVSAAIVTYATLADMLGDTNRTGVFTPNPLGFGVNIVGSGSDGSSYWNVFNIEGESALSAQIVTYATLADMLGDTNRTGVFTPNPLGFGVNIVGSGADILGEPPPPGSVPEPGTIGLLGSAVLALVVRRRRLGRDTRDG
jgi:aminoglycoside phosphotransferase